MFKINNGRLIEAKWGKVTLVTRAATPDASIIHGQWTSDTIFAVLISHHLIGISHWKIIDSVQLVMPTSITASPASLFDTRGENTTQKKIIITKKNDRKKKLSSASLWFALKCDWARLASSSMNKRLQQYLINRLFMQIDAMNAISFKRVSSLFERNVWCFENEL